MKNCLIISESFNDGPTGIVLKNIVDGITISKLQPLLITYTFKEDGFQNYSLIINKKSINNRFFNDNQFHKLKLILFKSFVDVVYANNDAQIVKNRLGTQFPNNVPEFILVIMSGDVPIRLLRLAFRLSKFYKIPFIIHSTDPLPSPISWGEKDIYRKAVVSAISPFYNKANLITAANPSMLRYQLNELKIVDANSFVLYNPTGLFKTLDNKKSIKNSFLYLGSLYGKRDPKILINGFIDLIDIVPDANLLFVGSEIILSEWSIPSDKLNNFKVIKWTDNPEKYIEEAEVLLDYNANIDHDVFLSSKLTKYISYNRKVLVISGTNSAPEKFLYKKENLGIWNISFSQNNFVQKALEVLQTTIFDWSDRARFCKLKNVDIQIENLLEAILNCRSNK